MKYELVKTDTKQFGGQTLYRIKALIGIGLSVSAGDFGGYVKSEKNLSQYGDAWVSGNACVSDDACVSNNACVSDDACVSGNACVYGNACVSDDACVSSNAWVYGNACVSDDACVSGNACVYGNAQVSGNALVYGNARVYGNAWVSGNACVSSNAWVSGNARVQKSSDHLQIGPAKSSNRFTTAFVDDKIGIRVVCGCFTGSIHEFSQQIEKTHANNKEHLEQYRLFCQLIAFNFGIKT